jgi:hypothetical protein
MSMIQVLQLFGGEELQQGQVFGVAGRGGRAARRRLGGEAAEGIQSGDGGQQEALLARPFLTASAGFVDFVFLVAVFGGRDLRLLRALPALHGLAEDGGALRLGKCGALPGGGAGPAFFDLAEVAGDIQRLRAEQFGNLVGGIAFQKEALNLGQIGVLVGRRRVFFVGFFVHGFLAFSRGFWRL